MCSVGTLCWRCLQIWETSLRLFMVCSGNYFITMLQKLRQHYKLSPSSLWTGSRLCKEGSTCTNRKAAKKWLSWCLLSSSSLSDCCALEIALCCLGMRLKVKPACSNKTWVWLYLRWFLHLINVFTALWYIEWVLLHQNKCGYMHPNWDLIQHQSVLKRYNYVFTITTFGYKAGHIRSVITRYWDCR